MALLELQHLRGEVASLDKPNLAMPEYDNANGDKLEQTLHFQEFLRLEIGKSWYLVSDPVKWKLAMKILYVYNGVDRDRWTDDGSWTGPDN